MPRAKPKLPTAEFSIERTSAPEGSDVGTDAADDAPMRLVLRGDWVIHCLAGMDDRLKSALASAGKVSVQTSELSSLDTAGALVLRSTLTDRVDGEIFAGQDRYSRLYELVAGGAETVSAYAAAKAERRPFWHHPAFFSMVDLGRMISRFGRQLYEQLLFLGQVITVLASSVARPGRIRMAPLVNIMQRAGLEAVLIVSMTNFFVGGVLAFLGILQLQQFGASVYSVDLVCIAVLREFAPVIAAVLLSGRSASAFAAEIGSMKMNQEIDAMRVLGIDPFEALVIPRVIGLCLMAPIVTFIGSLAGMFGGAVVVWGVLGLGPDFFVSRLAENVPAVNLFVGMIKTPLFAFTIALVGCRMGMNVKEDVVSLGRQVTTAVVHSIFLVFMIDAVIAILFNGFVF